MGYDSIPGPPPAPWNHPPRDVTRWTYPAHTFKGQPEPLTLEITTAMDREPRYLQMPPRPASERIVDIPWVDVGHISQRRRPDAEVATPKTARCSYCGNRLTLDGAGACVSCGGRS